jgi:hypothetical protein
MSDVLKASKHFPRVRPIELEAHATGRRVNRFVNYTPKEEVSQGE